MSVRGQRVLITGASGGLGLSMVEAFLALGAEVIAVGRRRTALDEVRAQVDHHERLDVAECDVSDPQGAERLFDSLERGGGPLDTVVHAVGAFACGAFADHTDAEVERLVAGNVTSSVVVTRAALRRMVPRGNGALVLVAADRALAPAGDFVLYGATKAAVTHLVQAMADETHGTGVRVNALLPGVLDTPANRQAMPDEDPGRWAQPRSVAASATWLAGPDARGVSGALLTVPGH